MKKSYKLLSIYLDRKPIPFARPKVIPVNQPEAIYDVGKEYTLFDLKEFKRKQTLSSLLACKDLDEMYAIINRRKGCNNLCLWLDYLTGIAYADLLFVKRSLQCLNLLEEHFPEVTFELIANNGEEEIYDRLLDNYY